MIVVAIVHYRHIYVEIFIKEYCTWQRRKKVNSMNIGIIDAELIGKSKHRFPNLCCMKISAFHKNIGDSVNLVLDYNDIEKYDLVYISKVFIKTNIPYEPINKEKTEQNCIDYYKNNPILNLPNVRYGGTGFFYDKAPALPYHIEHIMPDYHLYDEWINGRVGSEFKMYKDYSIGFLTRGCFRKCDFCVNKKYNKCIRSSLSSEFIDPTRKKICLLDDNFFAYDRWKEIITELKAYNKPFLFKQGLDERLLTTDKIKEMASWKYDGDWIFAFDNIADKDIIIKNLTLINDIVPNKRNKRFYVFCGYDRNNTYDNNFWIRDIKELFERIKLLKQHNALPYIMRHENYNKSPFKVIYNSVAAWCNQPAMFRKFDFNTFYQCRCMGNKYSKYKRDIEGYLNDGNKKTSTWKFIDKFKEQYKEIHDGYFYI